MPAMIILTKLRKKTCSKVPTSVELILTNTCIMEKDSADSSISVTALVLLPLILKPPFFPAELASRGLFHHIASARKG